MSKVLKHGDRVQHIYETDKIGTVEELEDVNLVGVLWDDDPFGLYYTPDYRLVKLNG
jgi:hypothetical protein